MSSTCDDALLQSLIIDNDVCVERSESNMLYMIDHVWHCDIDCATFAFWEYGWVYMNIGIYSCETKLVMNGEQRLLLIAHWSQNITRENS